MDESYHIHFAEPELCTEIARVLRTTRDHSLPYLPNLHTAEEDVVFIRDVVLLECTVLVASSANIVVGFVAYRDGWIDHLYILPEHQGRGIGTKLLQHALKQKQTVELWTFQRNTKSRRFYEANGFVLMELTDGQENEEKEPDVRYKWSSFLVKD